VQQYVNHKSLNVPQEVKVRPKPKRLTVQMDELWSFVDDFGNEQFRLASDGCYHTPHCRLPYYDRSGNGTGTLPPVSPVCRLL